MCFISSTSSEFISYSSKYFHRFVVCLPLSGGEHQLEESVAENDGKAETRTKRVRAEQVSGATFFLNSVFLSLISTHVCHQCFLQVRRPHQPSSAGVRREQGREAKNL